MFVHHPRRLTKLEEYRANLYKKITWVIFIVRCKDGTYYGGMTRNLKKELLLINVFRKGFYFNTHPERVPVELMYKERAPFKEANAKYTYLRDDMNQRLKKKLIATKVWPYGGGLENICRKEPSLFRSKKRLTVFC